MIPVFESIRLKVLIGLESLTPEGRTCAWQVLLGIDMEAPDIVKLRSDYWNIYMLNSEGAIPGSNQASIEKQLVKDCVRTFTEYKAFTQTAQSGQNRLFNVLKAYSLYDRELGYTQGLNFIAAMILLKVSDESLAFVVFTRIL